MKGSFENQASLLKINVDSLENTLVTTSKAETQIKDKLNEFDKKLKSLLSSDTIFEKRKRS